MTYPSQYAHPALPPGNIYQGFIRVHPQRMATAFPKFAAGPELAPLQRHATRPHWNFQSVPHTLILRQARIPNEPNPIIEHLPALSKAAPDLLT